MLEIKILGTPVVTVDGAPIDVDTRKAIALLAFLAVEHSADRDHLAALFWADSSPERARATLRRTLSSLRGGVGREAIEADRNQVTLAGDFASDVETFAGMIQATRDHGHAPTDVCPACVVPLTRAGELYRGDFLGAFAVRDSPEFEDWARSVTESYRLQAGEVFRRLAMAVAATGDFPGAIEAATRWVELDGLHEPAHRLLMLLNAWAGDRPGAIQAYRGCVAILDRELGVAPLEETTELYEAILDEDLPPAPGIRKPTRAHAAPKPAPSEMLDRTSAFERFEDFIVSARSTSRLCLLTGDSWMGKTRLLEEVVGRCRRSGLLVVSSVAFRAETKLPYGIGVQVLDGILGQAETPLERVPAWVVDELARIDPRLTKGEAPSDSGRLGELRLREAFSALIESAATRQMLLVVDDAQWVDAASANLLAHLRRRASEVPVAIVIATRDLESLQPALRALATGADATIHLDPLSTPDLVDEHPDVDLPAILRQTAGIPLLVSEALESGQVAAGSDTVARYMKTRSSRISDLARQVLAAAAVLDGMCDATLLRDTSGRTEDEIVNAVEELTSVGLIRELEDGRIGFTLDVLEAVTYESTSLIRRRLLHRRAAQAMLSRPRAVTDVRMVTAAAAHMKASGSDDAADMYRRAGDLARSVYANDEAMSSYENALALGHAAIGEVRLALGELAMARGDYETAINELRIGAAQSQGPTLALIEHRIGDLNRLLGRFELAEESFTRAEPDHPSRADLYADWALLKHRTGDPPRAIELAHEALAAAESEPDDPTRLARSLNILGVVLPDRDEAMTHVDAALAIAGPDATARMAALNNKAYLVAADGDFASAIDLVAEAVAIAELAGYRHHQAALLDHLADLYHSSGRDAAAEEALTGAVTLFADVVAGDWEPEVWLLRQW